MNMKFHLLPLISSLLFLLFISTISASPSQQLEHPNSPSKTLPFKRKLSSSNDTFQFYQDGCTAVLKGYDDIYSNISTYHYLFSTWENQNANVSFFGFLEHSKGIITKLWKKDIASSRWKFYLRLYDGNHIDQKFVEILIDLDPTLQLSALQSNGTFKTKENITLKSVYGENNKVESQKGTQQT